MMGPVTSYAQKRPTRRMKGKHVAELSCNELSTATAQCNTQALVLIEGQFLSLNEGLRIKMSLAVFRPMR